MRLIQDMSDDQTTVGSLTPKINPGQLSDTSDKLVRVKGIMLRQKDYCGCSDILCDLCCGVIISRNLLMSRKSL